MNVGTAILDLIYPPKCPFCGRVLDRDSGGMCAHCRSELPWTAGKDGAQRVEFCEVCLSPLWYRDRAAEGVRRYKFRGGQNHAPLFGELMARCLREHWEEPVDLITWVPLSAKRLAQRGYDQARLLAEQTAAHMGVPAAAALEKLRDTQAQSGIRDEAARRGNARGVYRVLPGCDVEGKHILLVDDVATTGATLSECAACLRRAGAASVTALTLARAGN